MMQARPNPQGGTDTAADSLAGAAGEGTSRDAPATDPGREPPGTTAPPVPDGCRPAPGDSPATAPGLARRVLAQARRTPDAVAVVDGARSLDYAELDTASAVVAHGLSRSGIRPGDAVAVCLPRSWQLVCVMLGILRLGATVVPLDVQSPAERRRHILADSASVAVVHGESARGELPDDVRMLNADTLLSGRPQRMPGEAAPAAVSFLFYTSGTTGHPKGVEVRDAGILRLARPGYIELVGAARYACLSNPAFDALSFEVWVPLLTGGCCVILGDETVQTPHLLAAALESERIDTAFITVALFNAVVDRMPHCFAGVGQVLVGGEQLNARLIRRWYRANPDSTTRLYNVYGPTESTTFALCHPIPRDFDGDVVPIGRALPGTAALPVVDGSRPAEPGEVAELLLCGEGLAIGYRNLPEETGRRFVRLPWLDGGRVLHYRTGDLVRSDSEGRISYVGRADRQVKVRGFRIEPGELERQIVTHPAVRQAYVCTRRDPDHGADELLAYLVLGSDLSYDAFARHLTDGLPAYMRPHRIHLVDELPLNANGKVDRAVLLAADTPLWRTHAEAAPTTGHQQAVLDLAAEILGVPGLRLGDGWIANGGDSLKALRLRFEIRRRWGCEIPQSLVLQGDFAQIAAAITPGRTQESPYPAPAAPMGAGSAPATAEQQRLWLLHQREPGSTAYNVPLAFRLDGTLDIAALRHALRRLVARHPALRTAFEPAPEGLTQRVAQPYDPWLDPAPDASDWRAFADGFFSQPFDLSDPRLLRACVLQQPHGAVLLLHLHHIAVDGWSLNVLFRELSADYETASAGEPVREEAAEIHTPLDFAAWQADWFASAAYRSQRAELAQHFGSLPEQDESLLEPVRPRGTGRLLLASLDPGRRATLDRLTAELGLTRFQVLLSVFAWSLYAVTGRTRPRIAGPVANRPVQEFESSVGMFANTVLLPLSSSPHETLRTQLGRQAADIQAVLDRQDVALADALADRDTRSDGPPFDFMFVLENTDFAALSLPGCDTRPQWLAPAAAKCPLTLSVVEHENGFDCLWEYADDHFDGDEVRAMAGLLGRGLDSLAGSGDLTLAELVAPYRSGLPDPGTGPSTPLSYASIAEGFARQAHRTPDAIALVTSGGSVTYAQLDAYTGALATELHSRFPHPQESGSVALHFEPSVEHVVALLALARLNLTIVPLDPAYPPVLLRHILDQVRPLCLLVAPGGAAAVDAIAPEGLVRHPVTLSTRAAPALGPHDGLRPLYTLFTSGSTGTPKGVQVPDRTLCNLLQWQSQAGGLAAGAVTQQFSMLSFDVSFQEIFGTLCGGGTLHLVRPGLRQDAPALLDQLEAAGAERIFMPYVALHLLAEHGVRLGRYPSKLRDVVTAGEQLLCTDAIRRWFAGMPGARLFNHYGPTETHVVSSLRLEGDPADWPARPSIGGPIARARLLVVDEDDEPVPPGCPGRLLICGPMAAPCYLGDAALNEARFVELAGLGLFYRSGDLARFDRQGLLHYLGRDDQQIKLSGHRLELGQVESALLRHPGIVNAVVVRDGERLVACLQCRGDAPAPEDLADHLAPLLPPYVRIDRFRRLDALPLTPSGKLDRRTVLSAPGEELRSRAAAAPVLSARGARLSELFEEVTGRRVGPEQRFFDAGASSLDLMRFHLRCTTEPGPHFTIPDLFEHVTVRRLARFLDGHPAEAAPGPELPAASDEPVAVIGMAVRLPGAEDLAAFWELVKSGGRGIEHFEAAEGLVGARSQMAGLLDFDPEHFGISRQEARLMDPQQRHLLMSSGQALAHAGIADPAGQRIGMVAGCGENTYFQSLLREADPEQLPDGFQLALHHDKDFLATKVAYHLDLSGPAFTVQAACASSLVAVHVAAGLLRQGEAEVMLAGGVLVDTLLSGGYAYRPQHIFSPDGHCRPFSDDADGTIGASGVGVVVLKPLRLARRDGDTVYAVITGSAVNNDGSGKLSYSAPSLAGQREVIRSALRRSGRGGADIGYVEAHGTGTRLGDPVEVGALRQAFGLDGPDSPGDHRCALSSVKSQIGHLGAAAGVVGLVRAALSVHHGVIPPTADFRRLNPQIGADPAPFHIPTRARPWPTGRPRVAAVSSFGIGGTNAHLILEESGQLPSPYVELTAAPRALLLSSRSAAGLRIDAGHIADYLESRPEAYAQVVRHLRAGRPAHRHRAAAVCADAAVAVAWLRTVADGVATPSARPADNPTASAPVAAWLAGEAVAWPAGPAQAPWDFPPPAFDLATYDFERAAPATVPDPREWPQRLPEEEWLYQPHWVRLSRAGTGGAARTPGVLVVVTAEPVPPEALRPFEAAYERVVRVHAAGAFARLADDRFEVDPADPASLRRLLDALPDSGGAGIDWLHALPLAVDGEVGADALDRARWACLDTPAALLQAVTGSPGAPHVRPWWLSYGAQPVEGTVQRPELGLLAGVCEVGPQECGVDGRWLDLPSRDPADWAALIPGLLAEDDTALPRRLALRQGYWWRQALLKVTSPAMATTSAAEGEEPEVHLVLGGTGGIGAGIAAWLLARSDCRVILLARRPRLPADLAPWADRVELMAADLAEDDTDAILARLGRLANRIDGVVHAAGVPGGGLIGGRDAAVMGVPPGRAKPRPWGREATAAKLGGALLVERLIALHRPGFAAYCSSMSALFGGVGQFDYAAANGLLDGFAHYRAGTAESTVRIGIDWDIWNEAGMARDALATDRRHQAHLAVGLTVKEGQRQFARALRLQLPQLLLSTTDIEQARAFYEPPVAPEQETRAEAAAPIAELLTDWLCGWLGVDELDPSVSLYDYGADSLTMLDLISKVKRHCGIDLELSQLTHEASLSEVLGLLEREARPDGDDVPLEVWQTGTGREVLCLVHPVGGDIQAYRALVSALDERFTVCLIADPALRSPERPVWSLADRARRYHAALQARFPGGSWHWRLVGWSFGAWVAHAMAAEAEAAGRPAEGLCLLDPPPPDAGPRFEAYDGTELASVFAHELGQGGAEPRMSEEARSYAERLARCCRANLASMARHELPSLPGTPARLWLASRPVPGLPDLGSTEHQLDLWHGQLANLTDWECLDTTHYDLVRPPQVHVIAHAINSEPPTAQPPVLPSDQPRPTP
ncbi:amino acid adenylation domain-containing protein [Streptomyces sp. NPDC050485]|uniref:amino acid adenylation domain-containing protein n=1 Tax=Streptomyces sp. NPDC050485 TaxID=3365617 RepID=UPI0037BCCEAC